MASNRVVSFTLIDLLGRQIRAAGGHCKVVVAGAYNKVSLFDANDVALANPVALNQGSVYFRVAKSVTTVDLYIMAPGGQFIVQKGVIPGSLQEIPFDAQDTKTVIMIPWAAVDITAATETDSGFDLPLDCIVEPHVAVDVATVDATETIDVGTLSTETGGNATGFIVAIPVDTVAVVAAKSAATATRGALIGGSTLDRGYSQSLNPAAKSISMTTSAGSDTGAGVILLPVTLSAKRFASAA